jgi:quercetin dioxygenase-like cupin family protein/peroxiredoxin
MRSSWVCALTAGGMVATGILGFFNYTWAGEVAPAGAPTVAQLMARDLDGISNKEALLITVTYLPGGASLPHRHDAQVFVYVLEGAMTMQVDGSAPVTLRPGQTFYEGPQDVHRVSANASQTEPAKILVFMVKDKRKPASRPVAAETTGQERAEAAGKGLVGSPAPRAVVKTIDGDTIDLGALYGKKAVYLKFWATWCVPCRQQMPHFEHTYETAGPDLAVIAIDVGFNESLEEIQRYRRALGITMPIILDDGQLGGAFNLRVTPQHIVIGRDGRIQYVGHLADARLDAALVAARQPALPKAIPASTALVEGPRIDVGDRLPAQSVTTLDEKRFVLRTPATPRPTVLVFLSPWCESYLATTRPAISASCRRVREQVDALAQDQRVRWIGIASGLWASADDLRKYRDDNKIGIPLTLDESGALFRIFRVADVPTILIADAQGKLIRRIVPDDRESLRQAIDSL